LNLGTFDGGWELHYKPITVGLPRLVQVLKKSHTENWLFYERHWHIDQMQQLSSHRTKEQAADSSKSPGPHEDVLNVFVASHAIDRFCNSAPLCTGDVANSRLAACANSLF
jgi:hypothetical protein